MHTSRTDFQSILNPDLFTKYFERPFKASSRSLVEFLIVTAVFVSADPSKFSFVLGAGVAVTGELLRIWTVGYGYKTGDFQLLGPYRYVRHPYFLGTILLFLGLCVIARNPYAFAFAVITLTLVFRSQLRHDEKIQALELGPKYTEYRSKVAAFIPQLVPLAGKNSGSFSLEMAIFRKKHRELDSIIGLAIAFGLLYLCWSIPQKEVFHTISIISAIGFIAFRLGYIHLVRRRRPRHEG